MGEMSHTKCTMSETKYLIAQSTYDIPICHNIPVFIQPGLAVIYLGAIRPTSNEVPMITRFLLDFRDTNCRLDSPTDVTIPKLTNTMPPRTGSGSRVKMAPNFPISPQKININPAAWNARLLAI